MNDYAPHTCHGRRGSRQGGLHFTERWSTDADAPQLRLALWPSRIYAIPVALFTLLWLRFLWRWYSLVLLATADGARGFLVLFGLPFLLAGVSLIGTSLRLVLGRTIVQVDALRLHIAEVAVFGRRPPSLVLPTHRVASFIAESSAVLPDDDRDLDSWHVTAVLHDGAHALLPLPVRTMGEADLIANRLNRALDGVRTPSGYRS